MSRPSRGISGALIWRRAYWLRREPGRKGIAIYLLVPALFFLPLGESGPFPRSAVQGLLIVILSLALGIRLGGGRGLRAEDQVWLSQKGVSLGDVALEDWILDLLPMAALSLWWGLTAYLASIGEGWRPLSVFVVSGTAFLLSLLTRTLVGVISAFGYRGAGDLAAGLIVISFLLFQVSFFVSPAAQTAIRLGTLPIFRIPEAVRALLEGDLAVAAPDLLHILALLGVMLWATYWRMERWRPLV